jgi:hypothetical protein
VKRSRAFLFLEVLFGFGLFDRDLSVWHAEAFIFGYDKDRV